MAVTPATIATALGVTTPTDGSLQSNQWTMYIADAYRLIEERRVDQGAPVIAVDRVDYAVKEAVKAHVQRPDDATMITVAVDDGSTSRRYESGKGRISLEEWWTYLGLYATPSTAFTIRPAGRTPDVVTEW